MKVEKKKDLLLHGLWIRDDCEVMLKFILNKNVLLLPTIMAIFMSLCCKSFALVGVEEVKNSSKKTTAKNANNGKKSQQNKSSKKGPLRTGERTDDIPEFPKDGIEEYKMLFDDGFSNIVDNDFQSGESFDVFVNTQGSNEINRNYYAGNDEFISQMDVVEAEKKTMIDNNSIDLNNVTTYRTRVMAYLTLEQMLYSDMFAMKPHGYYVNAVQKK